MNWIALWSRRMLDALLKLFTSPIVTLGGNRLSLGSLLGMIVMAIAVYFIARRLSDWLSHRLLKRLGIDLGTREAIAAMTSYLLAVLGFLVILQTAGINLSSLTVLAGVVGIGVGFGLQNLASNFFSGLTLLLEQPIRVGDFIEVDGLLGTVEKISIRATTVRTLDGVFVIVPNLRFVESNIINWSYRDPRCRLHIPVGVAYGSEPLLVTEALLTAARMEPSVLPFPPPKVWFQEFGESSLNFELLVWIDQPQDSEPIKSSLNFLLEQELRRRNIEIPFPQRDVWIRNWDDMARSTAHGFSLPSKRERHDGFQTDATPIDPQDLPLRDLLRRVTYFEQCTDFDLRQLIEFGYRQFVQQGQEICHENEAGDTFYIILSGSVEVFSEALNHRVTTLHHGDFFGELSLLLDIPRSATVRSLEDTVLFVVDRTNLQSLLRKHRELADQLALALVERKEDIRARGLLKDEDSSRQTLADWIRQRLSILFGI
jgi:small-conductance mechanosensitive channel/CRP-like cAMP-binding protein